MNKQGIYSLFVDFEEANVFMINDHDEELFYSKNLIGETIADYSKLPKFELISSKRTSMRDFMLGRDQAPIISQKAHDALFDLIHEYVQFISIGRYKNNNYYLLNVLAVVDALDMKLSDITYSEEDPDRIILITKYVFKQNAICDLPLFKIPQRQNKIFVTYPFVNKILQHKLTGVFVENPTEMEFSKANPLFGLPFKLSV